MRNTPSYLLTPYFSKLLKNWAWVYLPHIFCLSYVDRDQQILLCNYKWCKNSGTRREQQCEGGGDPTTAKQLAYSARTVVDGLFGLFRSQCQDELLTGSPPPLPLLPSKPYMAVVDVKRNQKCQDEKLSVNQRAASHRVLSEQPVNQRSEETGLSQMKSNSQEALSASTVGSSRGEVGESVAEILTTADSWCFGRSPCGKWAPPPTRDLGEIGDDELLDPTSGKASGMSINSSTLCDSCLHDRHRSVDRTFPPNTSRTSVESLPESPPGCESMMSAGSAPFTLRPFSADSLAVLFPVQPVGSLPFTGEPLGTIPLGTAPLAILVSFFVDSSCCSWIWSSRNLRNSEQSCCWPWMNHGGLDAARNFMGATAGLCT